MKKVVKVSFDEAVTEVQGALSREGFGILTDIDVAATFKQKLGVDFGRYRILGACNPKLAHRALEAEPDVGLLLPCNVVVREAVEGTEVGIFDPLSLGESHPNPVVKEVAADAAQRLSRVLAALA